MTQKPDALFEALDRAKPLPLQALGHLGVERIEYLVGFSPPFSLSVLLGTVSDAQRDALGTEDPQLQLIEQILASSDVPRNVMGEVISTAQSQETVDRDYAGKWFYALR